MFLILSKGEKKLPKKKDFFEKIVKHDYHNELETILEQKDFDENAKSTLLSILYKVEAAYPDVKKVKQDIETKEEYVKYFLYMIDKKCESLTIVHMNSEQSHIPQNRTYWIDPKKKSLECYPIERKVLYAISKLAKQETIIHDEYFLIHSTLSDLINVGNSINMVEPLRDFNGYSWTTIPSEIESIEHNLVYQTLRMAIGHDFLNRWVRNTEFVMDYYEMFQEELEQTLGGEEAPKWITSLCRLSVLLPMKYEPQKAKEMKQIKNQIDEQLEQMQDRESYVEKLTEQKTQLTLTIKTIDETINNKELLEQEYIKRNAELPLEQKIFSMRVLGEIMVKEREQYFLQIEEINLHMNPQHFVDREKELQEKETYLSLLDIEEIETAIEQELIQLEQLWIKALTKRVEQIQEKAEMISILYQFRYFRMIPFSQEEQVQDKQELQEELGTLTKLILQKAHQLKVIIQISPNEEVNKQIAQRMFYLRSISLENLSIKLTKEKEDVFVQFLEEDRMEEKFKIGTKDEYSAKELKLKWNKKMKLFE